MLIASSAETVNINFAVIVLTQLWIIPVSTAPKADAFTTWPFKLLISDFAVGSEQELPLSYIVGGNMLDSARDKPAVLDHIISVLSKILRSWLQKRSLADLPVMVSVTYFSIMLSSNKNLFQISLFRVVTNILKYISNNDVKVSMKSVSIHFTNFVFFCCKKQYSSVKTRALNLN